jgi:hypothetical protein
LQLGDAALAELACRIQIGTPLETVLFELREVRLVAPAIGFHRRPDPGLRAPELGVEAARPLDAVRVELGQIARSLEDKAKEIERVYGFYDDLCAEEYGRVKNELKASEFEPRGGLSHYRMQRPFYFARGVVDPPSVLNRIRTKVTFLDEVGVTGGAQQELVDVLDEGKRQLEAVPVIGRLLKRAVIESIPPVGKRRRRLIGGWNPRPILDAGGRPISMSPHAVGYAVDIKAKTNEHLKGGRAKAIDAVLDHLQAAGTFPHAHRLTKPFIDYAAIEREPDRALELAMGMWTSLMAISVAFKGFLEANLPTRAAKQPLAPDVAALLERCVRAFGLGTLERVAKQGLYDEHLALVVALVRAGARYGGEFRESKDEHHFEVRDWQRKFKAPRCIEEWKLKRRRGTSSASGPARE